MSSLIWRIKSGLSIIPIIFNVRTEEDTAVATYSVRVVEVSYTSHVCERVESSEALL